MYVHIYAQQYLHICRYMWAYLHYENTAHRKCTVCIHTQFSYINYNLFWIQITCIGSGLKQIWRWIATTQETIRVLYIWVWSVAINLSDKWRNNEQNFVTLFRYAAQSAITCVIYRYIDDWNVEEEAIIYVCS